MTNTVFWIMAFVMWPFALIFLCSFVSKTLDWLENKRLI